MRDFKIDASDITSDATKAISINEASNNSVLISNVYAYMPASDGIGIDIDSDYVNIVDCTVDRGEQGINCSGNYCKILTNTIKNLTGEDTPDVPGEGNAGDCESIYGIYNTGTEVSIINNIIINLTGGAGGKGGDGVGVSAGFSGGDGGSVYGIYSTGQDCIIIEGIINSLTGGAGGVGGAGGATPPQSGGAGGHGGSCYGIYNTATNCNISLDGVETLIGGAGGNQGTNNGGSGNWSGNGGSCYGINNNNDNCNIVKNNIRTFTGGAGGNPTGGDAGTGGHVYCIYNNSEFSLINDNNVETITSGAAGAGGTGGNAYGIAMNNCTDCVINGNSVNSITAVDSGNSNGLDDLGTADWNIWTSNSARGEGEGINIGNSIKANNLT